MLNWVVSFSAANLVKRPTPCDPLQPVAVFWSSDRSTFDTGRSLNSSSKSSLAVDAMQDYPIDTR
jgi:transcription initiation factor TFIID subunit TAF12